ncbi:cytochrome c [Epibacterium ulvae]|uniref:c-type cytochrome n=1 Tax=Epibacterium ulvae TaxID=1156985 RepID=UPI001BFC4399|nr:cytochrome c [Epibacterium ulvae]MBT8154377.1 cytochrome c [Epibacterium ulvae]
MRNVIRGFLGLGLIGAAAGFWITAPRTIDPQTIDGLTGDAARGEQVFWAGGCASCHASPSADSDDMILLTGGKAFATDFGTFYAPNITSDPTHGIGVWRQIDLANAILAGVSPSGKHYYPAFPYTSYARLNAQDVVDLWAFMQILPPSDVASKAHDVSFPFSVRRGLGLWKQLFAHPEPVVRTDLTAEQQRGQYLVEGTGHCGECHSPRNALGGIDYARWLGGAPNPSGKGTIPNITSGALDWSEGDIAEYLSSGFTPEFDSAGGEMAEVVENTARLPQSDRDAIAAYLKAVPPVSNE